MATVKRYDGMVDQKFAKHCSDFDTFLKKAKKQFEVRWRADFKPNAELSQFNILRTLGTGAFGRVVLVEHTLKEDQLYAIKMLEKSHIVKTKQVRHVISEIRILDSIRFEFLIDLEYFFKDNVYLFLAMPFINGGEMFSHLRSLKKFDESLARFYAAQVVLAFEYLHYCGLVYRDLKPENILLDKDGYIKITDLGFCKKIDDQRTYTLCGTPEYLAPEIILSQGYNHSVDWWALGILIFEMNAGYPPFFAKDPMRIYEKIVAGKFSMPPHFSKPLKDLIQNILQVDRTKRLGCLKHGGKEIKGHDWFQKVEWEAILKRRSKPIYKPKIKGYQDTTNFELFEEEPLKENDKEQYAQEFADFKVI